MELEREVESRLCTQVAARGGLCLKWGVDGWPDRIVICPVSGKTVYAELKRRTGRASQLQRYRHAQLRRCRADVRLLFTAEEVDAFVRELFGE